MNTITSLVIKFANDFQGHEKGFIIALLLTTTLFIAGASYAIKERRKIAIEPPTKS